MFKTLPDDTAATVGMLINGTPFRAPAGCTVAAALLLAGITPTRTTPINESPRAPYCMMGVCFECLVEIDGAPNQQSCLVPVAEGMRINRQLGKVEAKL
ncbi:MAG: sarcosine oxidase subunit alpha [Betaproteobacteria bacterium]|nr:sarcosine oxidase subunit alpha [Betaproteobacteria bacterium]